MARFVHPWHCEEAELVDSPLTLQELGMVACSYYLRSQPSWWEIVEDPNSAYRDTWYDLCKNTSWRNVRLSHNEVMWVLNELVEHALLRDKMNGVQQSCCPRVYESDTLISPKLEQELLEALRPLENASRSSTDWQPNSTVITNLVDPSLHCAVVGKTLSRPHLNLHPNLPAAHSFLPTVMKNSQLHLIQPLIPLWAVSEKYAWLATEFDVSSDGTAKARSYINNVHPFNTALVAVIEKILSKSIALIDPVLTDLLQFNELPRRIPDSWTFADGSDPNVPEGTIITPTVPDPEESPTSRSPGSSQYPPTFDRSLSYTVRGTTLQVFTKVMSIELAPENPVYAGTGWHLDGMANENILAVVLYCFASENVTTGTLSFRTPIVFRDGVYEPNHDEGVKSIFGFDRESEANQFLGDVQIRKGRCIGYGNVYQHQESSITLVDPSKPGHRKCIILYVAHPDVRVLSTTNVPPQQATWYADALSSTNNPWLNKLPAELLQMISMKTGLCMTDSEAKEYRAALLAEREAFRQKLTEELYELGLVCEHEECLFQCGRIFTSYPYDLREHGWLDE